MAFLQSVTSLKYVYMLYLISTSRAFIHQHCFRDKNIYFFVLYIHTSRFIFRPSEAPFLLRFVLPKKNMMGRKKVFKKKLFHDVSFLTAHNIN